MYHHKGGNMGNLSNKPNDNESPKTSDKSRWLEENDLEDEFFLLISGMAKCCAKCKRTTRNHHLDEHRQCPDCR